MMTSYPSHDYFRFKLKRDRYLIYRKRTSIIFILNVIAFIYLATQKVSVFQSIILIVVSVMLLLFSAFCIYSRSSRRKDYIIFYLLPAAVWVIEFGFWPVTVIMLLLMVLNMLVETDTTITVSGKGIEISNFRIKLIQWQEMNNVVLKDGLLSLDFSTNKIFQAEPDFTEPFIVHSMNTGSLNNTEWMVGEEYPQLEFSFNTFTKQQLQHTKE